VAGHLASRSIRAIAAILLEDLTAVMPWTSLCAYGEYAATCGAPDSGGMQLRIEICSRQLSCCPDAESAEGGVGAPPWTCLTSRRRLIGMLPIECRPDAAVSWRRRMVGWSRDRTMGGSLQLAQGEARFGRVFVSPRMNSRGLGVAPAAWGRGSGQR